MPVRKPDPQVPVRRHFRKRQVRSLDIEVAFHDLDVGRDAAQELVRFLVCKVAETEDLADFAGGEEFAELQRMLGAVAGGRWRWGRGL